jgi:hypothetical protein
MARRSEENSDKVLWLTLAQSWVRLAEHAARAEGSSLRPDDLNEAGDVSESLSVDLE